MIGWKLSILLFLSIVDTAVPSLADVNSHLAQLSLESESPATIFEISEQGNGLNTIILDHDAGTAVEMIEERLLMMLKLGFSATDIALTISSLPIDPKTLVLIAVERGSHTLLRYLQGIYIWSNNAQFHWFKALSYLSPWYDKDLWKIDCPVPMDWIRNIRAVCQCDNGALATMILEKIPPGKGLEKFTRILLRICVEYDAINVFKAMRMKPSRLKRHIKLLSAKSSAKLLELYQRRKKVEHLHLERFPFPERLPANAVDFKFLLRHGYDCFSMTRVIERFCWEGRLDLLKVLHELNPNLVPVKDNLEMIAERGWLHILQWAFQLKLIPKRSLGIITMLLVLNRHIKALDWFVCANEMIVDDVMIEAIAGSGVLEALIWVVEKQSIEQGQQDWADSAAENCHLPILDWLYKKFKLLPNFVSLGDATIEMLEWIKAKDSTMINAELVQCGASNLKLLQWIFENAPISIFQDIKYIIAAKICSMEMMLWLYQKLDIHPLDLHWAYNIGDLKAIEWAWKNCKCIPSRFNIFCAARKGHLNIIRWIHERHLMNPRGPKVLEIAIQTGNLIVADYLMLNFKLNNKNVREIEKNIYAVQRLNVLKWIYMHNLDMSFLPKEMVLASSRGDLRLLIWITRNFPTIPPELKMWKKAAMNGHYEVYRWLLEKYNGMGSPSMDILRAFKRGHLGVVRVILAKNPLLVETISQCEVTRLNYHIKQWLATNFR